MKNWFDPCTGWGFTRLICTCFLGALLIALTLAVISAHFEAASYNKLTGSNATT